MRVGSQICKRGFFLGLLVSMSVLALSACQSKGTETMPQQKPTSPRDVHSYANPAEVRVKHIGLDLEVLFDQKILKGATTLTVERSSPDTNQSLMLDTRDLKIDKAETSTDGKSFTETAFKLGAPDRILGSSLQIELPAKVTQVRIEYSTSPEASGLQWLNPQQTAGKKHPFVFTQSQAIHARSWIPLQDTPQARITYTARIRTPGELLAVMSAENDASTPRDGDYTFEMRQPIPSYLMALAVGDLAFELLGPRTGVYAEPSMVKKAAYEFADTEKMITATESLYGPYQWGRYDLLVLPPSFPFGGMENPRLTFLTPTVIAGDRSLVSLIAHELAHSWSGNLVTNATWRDFWLNEGFTTYLERRIIEAIYGERRKEMEAVLGRQDLQSEIDSLDEGDEILYIDLSRRDPDDGATKLPYEKGALFLRHLEETFGRERFDEFLKSYFGHFAFQSITTDDFIDYLKKNLFDKNPELASKIPLEDWIYKPGVPASAPSPKSDAFSKVEQQADLWLKGEMAATKIDSSEWTTQEWLHFLRHLPKELDSTRMKELDEAFKLTESGNSEIAHQWLLMSIRNKYEAAYPRLEEYLLSIGRRKLIKPLYEEMAKTEEGRARALKIYGKARSGYHPIAVTTIDDVLKWRG